MKFTEQERAVIKMALAGGPPPADEAALLMRLDCWEKLELDDLDGRVDGKTIEQLSHEPVGYPLTVEEGDYLRTAILFPGTKNDFALWVARIIRSIKAQCAE